MGTSTKTQSSTAARLALAVLVMSSASAMAGPLTGLAGTLHKGAAAAHPAMISLNALHPSLGSAHPAMPLDVPRQNTLDLRAPAPQLAPAEEVLPGMHNPQGLHWEDASAPVSPRLITLARNYHHDGLPVVKLWQANRNMVSIGLNPHGVPGIFFTQTMGR